MTTELLYVLDIIKEHTIFKSNDFRLVGGTALSYHLKHRISEDLDFFILKALPREDIDNFIEFCIDTFGVENVIPQELSEDVIYYFALNCDDIDDVQQDWFINKVKVSFVDCSQHTGLEELLKNDEYILDDDVKITSVDTIFKMKSLMFYKRTKSRDYFDLLHMYKNGYTAQETIKAIQKHELAYQGNGIDMLYMQLKYQKYNAELDESLEGLTDEVKSFEVMKDELVTLLKSCNS